MVTAARPLFVPLVWNAAADALLGAQSDRSLATLLGVHPQTVQNRRKALRIPPWRQPKARHERLCVVCGDAFVVVGGRASRLRVTCSKRCESKLHTIALRRAGSRTRLKQLQGLMGMHLLKEKPHPPVVSQEL